MKRIVQKIKSYSQSIELSEKDKDDLRAKITSFMHAHPMQVNVPAQHGMRKSPYAAFAFFIKRPMVFASIMLLIAGGSIASAAEHTLPGDVLYPIKVYINENVYGALVFTNKAEAAWHATIAERRFEEIERLIARGELTEEKAIIIEAYLSNALRKAEVTADPVALGAVLEAHAAILKKIDHDNLLQNSKVTTSIDKMRASVEKKKYLQHPVTNTESGELIQAPNLLTATEKQSITKKRHKTISAYVEELDLDKKTRSRVNARLDVALDSYEEGVDALESGNYTHARDKFIESIVYMQEAKIIASFPHFTGLETRIHINAEDTADNRGDGERKDTDDNADRDNNDRNNDDDNNKRDGNNDKEDDSENEEDREDDTKKEENDDKEHNDRDESKDKTSDDIDIKKDTEEAVKALQNEIQSDINKLLP